MSLLYLQMLYVDLYFTTLGVGNSMIAVAGLLILDKYFHKKKSMATSISTSGVGVAMFIFLPLMNFFMEKYGFQVRSRSFLKYLSQTVLFSKWSSGNFFCEECDYYIHLNVCYFEPTIN